MEFYQENKINPLASCLPLLLQLPVFIALFYAAAQRQLPDGRRRRAAPRSTSSFIPTS